MYHSCISIVLSLRTKPLLNIDRNAGSKTSCNSCNVLSSRKRIENRLRTNNFTILDWFLVDNDLLKIDIQMTITNKRPNESKPKARTIRMSILLLISWKRMRMTEREREREKNGIIDLRIYIREGKNEGYGLVIRIG